MGPTTWVAVLPAWNEGAVLECVRAVADHFHRRTSDRSLSRWVGNSRAARAAEAALLLSHAGEVLSAPDLVTSAARYLDEAVDAASTAPIRLLDGLLEVALTVHVLNPVAADLGMIDSFVLEILGDEWPGEWELLYGLAGIGVYLLARRNVDVCRDALDKLIGLLERGAIASRVGLSWRTDARFVGPSLGALPSRQQAPDGYFALGMAHGVAGIVALLSRMHLAGVGRGRVDDLLRRSTEWLRHQKQRSGPQCYPRVAGMLDPQFFPGWCWGDLGVALALYASGIALKERAYLREGEALGLQATNDLSAGDTGFCHGSMGVALIAAEFFNATGNPRFAGAAEVATRKALGSRVAKKGIGGFRTWSNSHHRWQADSSLLTGAAGSALSLISLTRPLPPVWSGWFLADISALSDGRRVSADRQPGTSKVTL